LAPTSIVESSLILPLLLTSGVLLLIPPFVEQLLFRAQFLANLLACLVAQREKLGTILIPELLVGFS
jgi:hypothetical protein